MSLPRKVQNLRKQYLEKRAHIATEEKLSQEIKKEMQECCPHPLVVARNGYGGSSSMDFDDAHDELRICCACGFYEYGKADGNRRRCDTKWEFKVLTHADLDEYFAFHDKDKKDRPRFLETHRLEDMPPLPEIMKLMDDPKVHWKKRP